MEGLERETAHLDTLALWIAFDYGGRAELVEAAQGARSRGRCRPTQIDEAAFGAHLAAPELPDIDLLIRTSGEQRISNFLLWGAAYAEFVFTETPLARLRRRRARGGGRRVRVARSAVRSTMSPLGSRHPRRGRSPAARARARLPRRLVAGGARRDRRDCSRCTSSTRSGGRCGRSSSPGSSGSSSRVVGTQAGGPVWLLGGHHGDRRGLASCSSSAAARDSPRRPASR